MALYSYEAPPQPKSSDVVELDLLKIFVLRQSDNLITQLPSPTNSSKKEENKLIAAEYHCSLQNITASTEFLADNVVSFLSATIKFTAFQKACYFGHIIALFNANDLNRCIATISLKSLNLRTIDKLNFVLENKLCQIYCKAPTEANCTNWINKIQHLNENTEVYPIEGYTPEVSMQQVIKRCKFSPYALFTEDSFRGGHMSDTIQYILYHCTRHEADNIMLSGLLVVLKENNLFEKFVEEIEEVFMLPKGKKSAKNWKSRIVNFTFQVCRSYRLLSPSERHAILSYSVKYLTSEQKAKFSHLASIHQPIHSFIKIRPNHVLPQWGKSQNNFHELSALTIAEQLTFFESKLHNQLDMIGLIENKGEALNSAVSWWNQFAGWISSSILCEPTIKKQKTKLKLFLKVAEHLVDLRNYSSAAQIVTGIKHHSVSRLRGLRDSLSSKTSKKIEKLEELFSPANNYAVYRNSPKNCPCLRFLAVHQRDIRFICDGNPLFLDKKKNVLSAERIVMIGECFNKLGIDYPSKSYEYNLKKHEGLQNLLSQLKTVSEDDLFTLSFINEPSRGGEQSPLRNRKVPTRTASNPLHNSQKLDNLYKTQRRSALTREPNGVRKRSASDLGIELSVELRDLVPVRANSRRKSSDFGGKAALKRFRSRCAENPEKRFSFSSSYDRLATSATRTGSIIRAARHKSVDRSSEVADEVQHNLYNGNVRIAGRKTKRINSAKIS